MGKRRTPIIISSVVIVSVLIGIALAVFFLVPRNPSETFGDPTYTGLTNTDTEFSIQVSIPFTVHNPNYYDIKLKSLNLEVDYNGLFLGNVIQNGGMTFAKRATTDHVITTTLTTTDSTLLSNIKSDVQAGNPLHLKFHGPGKFTALSITVTRNFSFTKDLKPSSL
eukprot:Phypoly_transcript_21238.p1 GENE.Phypoly_transcript_21238~~Phypoly_transcript_21238.p1  ORF type:complete len:166 (+),score=18.38 Phypoly_transcript_21238:100-597(+)